MIELQKELKAKIQSGSLVEWRALSQLNKLNTTIIQGVVSTMKVNCTPKFIKWDIEKVSPTVNKEGVHPGIPSPWLAHVIHTVIILYTLFHLCECGLRNSTRGREGAYPQTPWFGYHMLEFPPVQKILWLLLEKCLVCCYFFVKQKCCHIVQILCPLTVGW